jgi:hypothetical protein
MTRATRSIAPHHLHQLQFSSPSAQFFQILSLVLSAAVPVVPSTGTKAAGELRATACIMGQAAAQAAGSTSAAEFTFAIGSSDCDMCDCE